MPPPPGIPDVAQGDEAPRCDPEPECYVKQYSDIDIDRWLEVTELSSDAELGLTGTDLVDAHTALRHIENVDKRGYQLKVRLPMSLRKNRAFTPWLHTGKTVTRERSATVLTGNTEIVVLSFEAPVQHMQSAHTHTASFDIRVAGAMIRTLLDSGANRSCISLRLVRRLGLTPDKSGQNIPINGVGGSAPVMGTVRLPVKLGKHQPVQEFLVTRDDIAGYDCVLGEDFFTDNSISLLYSPGTVQVRMLTGQPGEQVVLSRKVHKPTPVQVMSIQTDAPPPPIQGSWKEYKSLMHDINAGHQMAYRISLMEYRETDTRTGGEATPTEGTETHTGGEPTPGGEANQSKNENGKAKAQSNNPIPTVVQRIIDKHSGPKGTLCGTIPPNTHAKGFECNIELAPGVRPVNIKQYRLTPLEKEELLARIQEFILKGWIEPSSSSWSSSVLFVPKPNGKLRFCVDFRHLNARTVPNSGPIPNQGELLDSLHGAKVFSALDLASGFYQLGLDKDSKPLTAFPTPMGLYQWCVMPMGLCNAPAVFQQAMNTILKVHILNGYCPVYLDDIIIKSSINANGRRTN